MPAEVLVMCCECGRPQPGGRESCVACGARLPPIVPPNGRDQLLDAFAPFLEADLGRGRLLTLSKRRLEWRPGEKEAFRVFELSELKSFQLSRRPVFESLLFALIGLALGVLVPNWAVRALLALFVLLAVAACFAQRRYAFVLEGRGGQRTEILLGVGRRGTPFVARVASIWESLSEELRELGVAVKREGP